MFIGRREELSYFEKRYQSDRAELLILYGRRRIGKTELLRKFCEEKEHIFYSAIETTDHNQLALFSKAVLQGSSMEKFVNTFDGWEDALLFLADRSMSQRKLLVIDEFPYLVNDNRSLPSILQKIWDESLKSSQLMLVLCGSSMAFMEKELLSVKNPLYGRTTGSYKMDEMDLFEASQLMGTEIIEEVIQYYGVFGGVPHYLRQIDSRKSFWENIADIALERGSILFNEVELLLRQELREVMTYYAVIQAIALGSTKLNEISNKVGIERTKLTYYLTNLIELGIVRKEFPVTMPLKQRSKSRKGLYVLKDNFFRFHFSYMYPYMTELVDRGPVQVIEQVIKPDFSRFIGTVFEKAALQYLNRLNKRDEMPFYFFQMGRWWEKDQEVDLVAYDQKDHLLLAECKWRNSAVGVAEFKKLQSRAPKVMATPDEVWYFLFSRSGFTKALIELSRKSHRLRLITLEDMEKELVDLKG
jgi:AAA+ ATPase superfamily predicted ATPase